LNGTAVTKRVLICALAIAVPLFAQVRFPSGEYQGFTISSREHEIVRLDKSIDVRNVRGDILFAEQNEALADFLFEIRGPIIPTESVRPQLALPVSSKSRTFPKEPTPSKPRKTVLVR
jgi:hypothetical protein